MIKLDKLEEIKLIIDGIIFLPKVENLTRLSLQAQNIFRIININFIKPEQLLYIRIIIDDNFQNMEILYKIFEYMMNLKDLFIEISFLRAIFNTDFLQKLKNLRKFKL